ncbi:predicted protein [Arabidopsis lyrata subsp. lyrata]|uniref:Predicted protein n=1 Tax=Arabidopsis lyrata subsp. lyrata TaxID=81972 RepID=D7LVS4_ARALL|nr:predicted protein [Arabidopsis lyrata subsp. lyrata]EFH52678.1 predicted protein [Arabidopsis lyrata subsp. lyrata]
MVKIPCSHAIAAAVRCDMRVPDLAAPEYGSFFWTLAYNGGIHPVPDLCTLRNVPDGVATLNVLPPLTRRPPGRPKRSRFLSAGEYKKAVPFACVRTARRSKMKWKRKKSSG